MTGELVMTVLLALARMERRRIFESWETAKVRALDRGAKIGPTPFGYRRAEGGRLEPHPERDVYVVERRAGPTRRVAVVPLRPDVPEVGGLGRGQVGFAD